MSKSKTVTRDQLVNACVRSLVEFGYEHVNATNIFTGTVERMFFQRLLEQARKDASTQDARVIDGLLTELDEQK